MLCCTLQCLQTANLITSILANVATALGMFGLIFAVLSFLRNMVNKRHLTLAYEAIRNDYFKLTFINYTNKEFSIISISLLIDGKEFPAEELTYVSRNKIGYENVNHISVYPYQSQDFCCNFRLGDSKLPKVVKFKVETTAKKRCLTYKIKQKSKAKDKTTNTKTASKEP